jgi:hypothetical protein
VRPAHVRKKAGRSRGLPGFAYCTVKVTSSSTKDVWFDASSVPVNLMVTV